MLAYLLIIGLIFLILWCSLKPEAVCLPQLSPKKVFPGGLGSQHLSTMSDEPYVERDYTYLLTKLDKPDKPICNPPASSPEFNKSYIASHALGPLVPGKPSAYQTDCYQYICPENLPEGAVCWRCGK